MADQQVLNNVPPDQVGDVVQSFCDDGATKVDVKKKGNGKFDVTATFPAN